MSFSPDIALVLGGFVTVLWASSYVLSPLFGNDGARRALVPTRSDELITKKERYLKALEELELDSRTKKITPGDYAQEKDRLLRQVAACMSELEAVRAGSDEASRNSF